MSAPFAAVTITLPKPPLPLSQCFVNRRGGGRHESKAYAAWKIEADQHLMAFHAYACGGPKAPKVPGLVKVLCEMRPRKGRVPDVDNCLKSVCDTLTRNYVIEDDSRIIDLHIKWGQFDMAHETVIEVARAA